MDAYEELFGPPSPVTREQYADLVKDWRTCPVIAGIADRLHSKFWIPDDEERAKTTADIASRINQSKRGGMTTTQRGFHVLEFAVHKLAVQHLSSEGREDLARIFREMGRVVDQKTAEIAYKIARSSYQDTIEHDMLDGPHGDPVVDAVCSVIAAIRDDSQSLAAIQTVEAASRMLESTDESREPIVEMLIKLLGELLEIKGDRVTLN